MAATVKRQLKVSFFRSAYTSSEIFSLSSYLAPVEPEKKFVLKKKRKVCIETVSFDQPQFLKQTKIITHTFLTLEQDSSLPCLLTQTKCQKIYLKQDLSIG